MKPDDQVPTSDHTLHAGLSCLVFVGDRSYTIELPTSGAVIIGRSGEADLRLVAEGVSRSHARLQIDRDDVTVSDLGSKNGTHVNGQRISATRKLTHGDEVRVGDARVVIARRSASASSVPLLLHGAFSSRLRIEVARAQAFGRPLALLLLRLDRSWFDVPLGSILAGVVRSLDVVGLHDDCTLEIILMETAEQPARAALDAIASAARAQRATVSASHAALERGASAEELAERALARLLGGKPAPGTGAERDGLVIADPVMRRIYEQVRRVAKGAAAVLVMGETGAGKELVARALHRESGRRGKLVTINAAALPEALLESELFGHERGAFTGAATAKAGLFEAADGGTLFLDEVGDLPLAMQAKLLRVLEDGLVRRVGANADRHVDVRVVAATNADLERLCAERRFRSDLMFRLNACTFLVPPLRDRPADVRALAEHFAARAGTGRGHTLTPEAMALLERYAWPGNVRELRNVIDRAALLCDDIEGRLAAVHFPDSLHGAEAAGSTRLAVMARGTPPSPASGVREDMRDYERERVEQALAAAEGNLTRAAELLGLPRKTLAYRVEKLGLRPHKRPG